MINAAFIKILLWVSSSLLYICIETKVNKCHGQVKMTFIRIN